MTRRVLVLTLVALGCGGGGGGGPTGPDRTITSIAVSPPSATVDAGLSRQFTAAALNAAGESVSGVTFQWEVSNPALASIDGTGRATGLAAGIVQVRAVAGGRTGIASLSVVSDPVITSVTPAQVAEGQVVTIAGTGFGPTAGANVVTVAGTAATINAATSTSIQIVLPSCLPTGPAEVVVLVGTRRSAPAQVTNTTAGAPLQLAVGQQTILSAAGEGCLRFGSASAAEAYLVGIQSTVESSAILTSVRVGTAVAPVGNRAPDLPAAALPVPPPRPTRGARVPGARTAVDDLLARHRAGEARLRAQERVWLRTGRLSLATARAAATRGGLVPAIGIPNVGDQFPVRIPDLRTNACLDFALITAEVKAVGQRGIWLDDVANPAGGFSDAEYAAMSAQFDAAVYPTLVDYYGEPTDIDENDRFIFVVTQQLNTWFGQTSALGFVALSQIFPQTTCPASNLGEYFFAIAPDPGGVGGIPLEDVKDLYPLITAHEATHIIQQGRRVMFPGATQLPASWILEGQATLTQEIIGFRLLGRAVGQNYGQDVMLDQTGPDWHLSHYFDLATYFGFATRETRTLGAPEQCSFLGDEGPCTGNMVYGVAWSFLRWVSDQFGPGLGGEQRIHRALIDNTDVGLGMVAATVGVPVETLLAQWAASLFVDDRVPGADSRLQWTTWNLFSVEQALVETAQLMPYRRGFSTFNIIVRVRGGSSAYFHVSGPNHPATNIRVRSEAGGPLPPTMQIWVVRTE